MPQLARGALARAEPDPDQAMMAHFLARPGFLLARVDQLCTAIHAGLADGETLAQAELLLLLDALGPTPQIALARAAGVDKSTTAYVLDNLEARDWVRRAPCSDDRRRALVSLTGPGRARIPGIAEGYAGLQQELQTPIAPDALPRLTALLHRLGSKPASPAPPWVPACHPTVGVLDGALSFLARRVLQLFQAQFLACAPSPSLTSRQFSLLFILSARESITQVAFARIFGLDPSTCAVVMRGLSARGLIHPSPSPRDRRERVYAITATGRAALAETQPLMDRSEQLVFQGEPAGQIEWLVGQLQAIVRAHSHRLRFPGAIEGLRAAP